VVHNWTGFTSAAISAARSRATTACRAATRVSWAACRLLRLPVRAELGDRRQAQYSWLNGDNNNGVLFPGGTLVTGSNNNQLGSVTGRVGYTWGPALLYAKGGYAWRDSNNIGVSVAGVPAAFATDGNHKDGYTVGTGLEYMFAPNWSAKAEYQYYNFGNTTVTAGPPDVVGARFRNDEHSVKVGLNYRFGWGGPVVAKY
jgi:outer membrane immunogenic protein